jgi:hypothetical protein
LIVWLLLADLGGRSHAHREIVWIATSGLFLAVLVGLLAAFRRLSRCADLERAEAVLADEYHRLEQIKHMSGGAVGDRHETQGQPH